MRALSAGELLDVWEHGLAQAPWEQALTLLAAASPDTAREALASLPIGHRDARLLALRERLWGPHMAAVVVCPECRERLELALDTHEMLAGSPPDPPSEIPLIIGEFKVTMRVPTTLDTQLGDSGYPTTGGNTTQVLKRCVLRLEGENPVEVDQLPQEVLAGIEKRMAEADPLADIQLDLTCPSCHHRWRAVFDIVSFLWTELEVWVGRILSDVHTLARAYGWSERDILALSPTRRQFYLEMVGA